MANIVSNAYMQKLLKTVYLDGVANNKYQSSPVLAAMNKKSWTGGKEIAYAAQYGNGGNFGSVFNTQQVVQRTLNGKQLRVMHLVCLTLTSLIF